MRIVRQAAILCGGVGSRLGALTVETPKPLLPVGGTPFLDVLLFELGRHGVKRVLLLAGFAAQRILDCAASTPLKARFDLEIDVSVEPQPGPACGLSNTRSGSQLSKRWRQRRWLSRYSRYRD